MRANQIGKRLGSQFFGQHFMPKQVRAGKAAQEELCFCYFQLSQPMEEEESVLGFININGIES